MAYITASELENYLKGKLNSSRGKSLSITVPTTTIKVKNTTSTSGTQQSQYYPSNTFNTDPTTAIGADYYPAIGYTGGITYWTNYTFSNLSMNATLSYMLNNSRSGQFQSNTVLTADSLYNFILNSNFQYTNNYSTGSLSFSTGTATRAYGPTGTNTMTFTYSGVQTSAGKIVSDEGSGDFIFDANSPLVSISGSTIYINGSSTTISQYPRLDVRSLFSSGSGIITIELVVSSTGDYKALFSLHTGIIPSTSTYTTEVCGVSVDKTGIVWGYATDSGSSIGTYGRFGIDTGTITFTIDLTNSTVSCNGTSLTFPDRTKLLQTQWLYLGILPKYNRSGSDGTSASTQYTSIKIEKS